MTIAPTLIGRVRHVLGARITAELLPGMAGTTPLFRGRVYQIGQIGSLVRVPHGTIELLGAVSMVGIAELAAPPEPTFVPGQGDRWLQFQLLGQLDAMGRFERGVSTYPALDDEVHFATEEHLRGVYPSVDDDHLHIGSLSTSSGQTIAVDLPRFVARHAAIVGSTGSGKTSAVARLLQSAVASGLDGAAVVLIDPHGEYAAAFGQRASVQQVLDTEPSALSVPYWALSGDDLLRIFGTGSESTAVRGRFFDAVSRGRLAFLEQAKWAVPTADDVTVDTPIPFDIREVWFELDEEDKAVYSEKSGHGDLCIQQKGSAPDLKPTVFELYGSGQAAPFKGPQYGAYRPLPDRMRMRLLDDRFRFLRRQWPNPSEPDPLPNAVFRWIGGGQPLSILDFSGVPPDVADVAIGAVLSHLYQIAVSCPADVGLGRARPIWVILEEAHRFLGKETRGSAHLAKEAAERIAREGRKYGLGLTIVSQRPSELSETILSQVGSVVALRLTNPTDQATVKATLPDVVANLAEALPALRTGEALITGECLPLPTRVMIDRPVPGPAAADPSFDSWRASAVTEDEAARAVAFWRGKNTT